MRLIVSLLVAAAFTSALLAGPVTAPRAAAQESGQQTAPQRLNAAAVVIDTGSEVRKVCVRFSEPEITGEELLRRAKVDAVFAEYSIGQAVCSLCGTGCPADDCFCESGTTGRYWNYARDGEAGWQRSSLGASSTTVRDGDSEGWAWGTDGAVPPWIGFESICVETESTPPKPASTPASVASAASPRSTPAAAHTTPPASTEPQPAMAPASEPVTPATTPPEVAETEASVQDTDAVTSASPTADAVLAVQAADEGGSGLGGVLGFAGAGALLGAGMFVARRRLG